MKKVLLAIVLALAIVAVGVGVASQMPDTASGIIAGIGTVAVFGMIADAQTRLSDAQAFAATGVSTNAYDLGSTTARPGSGTPLCIVVSIDVGADHTTGDETYEFQLVQATANDLTTGQDILVSQLFTAAMATANQLIAGNRVIINVPMGRISKRFFGLRAVLGGTTPTITLTADVLPLEFVQNEQYYADSIQIS